MIAPAGKRKLAAILAADVVGYSRLMEADEEGTLGDLKACRSEIIEPSIACYQGRTIKLMGDGALVEFPSVVEALRCAVEVQTAMGERNTGIPQERRLLFRIGINLGDVIIDGDDSYGDGVNIAARLEGLAEPGSICVSATVHDHVGNKLPLTFIDIGEQTVKNIAKPVRVYRVGASRSAHLGANPRPSLPLPDKPSIAVLPFQNMSGDPDQEYFADGMVEEIITALSRFRPLFVIARNSSFAYKGRSPDIREVGRDLGVRYVLEGSVRKGMNRARITGQLIDTASGAHLWADRFDGDLKDVFDLQDQVTASVVGAIAPKLERAEIDRAKRKPTDNLDAYDYFLRGMASFHVYAYANREGNVGLVRHFSRAIELDAEFATPYAMAAWCCFVRNMSLGDRAKQ
jgi:TolB-like protein/class 3 adenylate cyclase